MARTKKIEVEGCFPYSPELVWQAIASKEALSQWLMQTDFEPVVGHHFQFRAEPMKGWRGWVDCEVLECDPPRRLRYSWQGMPEHSVTTVSYELEPTPQGTRVRAVHEGFDHTHGFLSGIMLRGILGSGWRRMFRKLLPPVLAELRQHESNP